MRRGIRRWLGARSVSVIYGATSSAILAATSAIDSSAVLRPLREPSRGLTSRRFSYVVSCTMGTSRSRARSAESSFSAMPSALSPAQQRRGHKYDPDSRPRQSVVDFAKQGGAEDDVLLAEPDRLNVHLHVLWLDGV